MRNAKKCSKCHKGKSEEEFLNIQGREYKQCNACRAKYSKTKPSLIPITFQENDRSIALIERIDKIKLNYMIAHHEKYIDPLKTLDHGGNRVDGYAQLTMMIQFHDSLDKNGEMEVSYRQKGSHGRYQSTVPLSLQNLSRKIRHTVCDEYLYDIDMKNAHPVLLSDYCAKNDIDAQWLDYYIQNRDKCLKEIMTKRI